MFKVLAALFTSICLCSVLAAGEFTSRIAHEMALVTMEVAEQIVEKVPRSQCKKCNGTGKMKVGDTVTVKIVECDGCFPDPKSTPGDVPDEVVVPPEPPADSPETDAETGSQPGVGITGDGTVPPPAAEPPPKVEVIEERGRRMLYVHAEWCVWCKPVEKNIFPLMRQHRWRIGNANTDQIQCIDESMLKVATEHIAINDVSKYPTFVVVEDGYEIDRHEGYLDQWGIARLWNRKPATPPAAKAKPVEAPGGWLNVKLGRVQNAKSKIIQFRDYLKLLGPSGQIEVKPDKPGEPVKFQINDKTTITFGMPFKLRYEIKGETISLIFETPPPVSYRLPLIGDKLGNLKEAVITTERIDITLEGLPSGFIVIDS